MANFECGCRSSCTGIALVTSIIIGVVAAFLRLMAVITVTPAFLWVTLGIAVGYLGILLIGSLFSHNNSGSAGAILAGILGTALLSVVLLAIPFVATSVTGAVLTGLLLFFVSLTLTAVACRVYSRI